MFQQCAQGLGQQEAVSGQQVGARCNPVLALPYGCTTYHIPYTWQTIRKVTTSEASRGCIKLQLSNTCNL